MLINKLIIMIVGSILMLISPLHLNASEDDQFYFIGMSAPIASMSNHTDVNNETAIYLRWDVVEGSLPVDIDEFILFRDTVEIQRFDANTVMTPNQISKLYIEPGQERRRFEIIDWLNKEDPDTIIDGTNFHNIIFNKLSSDTFWSLFASRIDFNIARARNRGYLDVNTTLVPGQSYSYELMASNASIGRTMVGRVTVVAGVSQVVEGAVDFKQQFKKIARCDAPERFKEHGTLYLNWREPGSNAISRYANSLAIAGYDLYRTTSGTGGVLDIRQAAMGLVSDSSGQVHINGIEKVNEQPILMSGTDKNETRHEGWNAPYSAFMEFPKKLKEKRIHPGDSRTYYLVARDFSGNYSQTVRYDVTIPDMTPPPAPWSVRTIPNSGNDTFKLTWLKTDVLNYHDAYQSGRDYCNLKTAKFDKKLSFVMDGQQCSGNAHQEVSLDPDKYLIYRFESINEAKIFKDSDGDGYSDLDERVVNAENPLLSSPGTACKFDNSLPLLNKYLVDTVDADTSRVRNSKAILEFSDPVLVQNKNKFYWYRIATKDHNGEISPLSAPVRGFFPKRELPYRATTNNGMKLGVPSCIYGAVDAKQGPNPWVMDFSKDASFATVVNGTNTIAALELNSNENYPTVNIADIGGKTCQDIYDNCLSGGCSIRFSRGDGTILAETPFLSSTDCSNKFNYELHKTCDSSNIEAVDWGDVVDGPLYLDLSGLGPSFENMCFKVFREINGEKYPLKTFCPDTLNDPIEINATGTDGAMVSYSVAVQDDEAQTALKWTLPSVILAINEPIHTPMAMEMQITGNDANLTWMPPKQEIVGSMIEWYKKGSLDDNSQAYFTKFIDIQDQNADGSQSVVVGINDAPLGTDWAPQEWCFRARAIGVSGAGNANSALSNWSKESCVLRQPSGGILPEYLGWPDIPSVSDLGNVTAHSFINDALDKFPMIFLSESFDAGCVNYREFTCLFKVCDYEPLECDPAVESCESNETQGSCPQYCESVKKAVGNMLGFVVYRQRIDPPYTPVDGGEYIQVSPLIDTIGCVDNYTIQDPYLQVVNLQNVSPVFSGYRVIFKDKYPYEVGGTYRYQLVYFNESGEIIGYRTSNKMVAN